MFSSQTAESFRGLLLRHRARTGLIQRDLAARAGVSRRSVQEWETGAAFPSAERLQALIRVLLETAGLTAGSETLEARELWTAVQREAPRMHTPFDEQWFAGLLAAHAPPTAHPPTDALHTVRAAEPGTGAAERAQDWGEAPDTVGFVGRAEELARLRHWVLDERCRLVTVVGMGGIGKTSLAARLARDVAPEFERVYWRGLRDAPPLGDWLSGAIGFLSDQQQASARSESERLTTLLQLLRERRCLLVLDNFETLFEPGQHLGRYRQGLTGYAHLVEVAAAAGHRSCVLLTSREAPAELAVLEGGAVRIFPLGGLAVDDVQVLLAAKRLTGTGDQWTELIARFGGNGLALKVVGESIRLVFGGDLGEYLEFGTAGAFGGIRRVLAEQIARSSALEQQVLRVLAVEREPLSLPQLLVDLGPRFGTANVIDAIEALRRRSLLESAETPGPTAFTLQSVVLEYVTEQLVQEVSHEIASGWPEQVVAQLLIRALGKDYVRQSQQRLIGEPVLRQLAAEVGEDLVEPRLLALLETWRDRSPKEQGYGPGNVVNLLSLHRGDLRSLDLSRLWLRGVYLQGVQMQDTSLSGASISESMATQAFDACWAVTISQDGQIWAAASKRGEVRVWQRSDQTLQLVWDAHTNVVPTIALSPDGRRLATGSYDGSVKVWDVSVGALLWTGRHTDSIYSVAFAPDGALLASGGNDASVRLWDPDTGTLLQTVPHTDPVFTVTWSPDGRWLASGGLSGQIRLWQIEKAAGAATCVETLEGHSNWVVGLAFAPDRSALASASHDGTVKLWDVPSGRLRETFTGHTDRVLCVAWSPDGRIIASGGRDCTIWLWDAERGKAVAALREHTAEVYSIAFTPDSGRLFSGSEDGTLRVWDVNNGQCTRVLHGYAVSLLDVDWSPDGGRLVSAGSNTLVTIWDADAGAAPVELRGHQWIVQGVAWSPASQIVASCGWDNSIRLWDAATSTPDQILSDADDPIYFFCAAWSADGQRLAAGTYMHGVLVWEVGTQKRHWVGHQLRTWIRCVAWSPDGARLVGGGDDGRLFMWDAATGSLLRELTGHQGVITSVAWHRDGRRLASGGGGRAGGELFVWDAQSGERVHVFSGLESDVSAVAWDQTGNVLVTGGNDGKLRWWDVQNGQDVRARSGHRGTIRSLKMSPDGTRVASCGDDGAIMLWNLDSGEQVRTLRRDRPYERLDITGIHGLTEAQLATLRALGAIEDVRLSTPDEAESPPTGWRPMRSRAPSSG